MTCICYICCFRWTWCCWLSIAYCSKTTRYFYWSCCFCGTGYEQASQVSSSQYQWCCCQLNLTGLISTLKLLWKSWGNPWQQLILPYLVSSRMHSECCSTGLCYDGILSRPLFLSLPTECSQPSFISTRPSGSCCMSITRFKLLTILLCIGITRRSWVVWPRSYGNTSRWRSLISTHIYSHSGRTDQRKVCINDYCIP